MAADARARGARRPLLRRILGRARRELWFSEEFRVYRMPASAALLLREPSVPAVFAIDASADLTRYTPDNAWDPSEVRFHAVVEQRRTAGHHVFSLVEGARLLHYSWLDPSATSLRTDFGSTYPLPPGTALLYDDNTHSSARGRGLHKRSLRARASHAATLPGVVWIYITVHADNTPSRRNIEAAGFEHLTSCVRIRRLGRDRLVWRDAATAR